jgi:hypothetical protein
MPSTPRIVPYQCWESAASMVILSKGFEFRTIDGDPQKERFEDSRWQSKAYSHINLLFCLWKQRAWELTQEPS